jgi:cation transport ATPase
VDIVISGRNGDVCITAEKNGRVRIRAQNIMIDADEDVDIKAGRNITLDAGSGRVLLKGNKLDANGLTGNLVPEGTSFGEVVFNGTFVGQDIVKAAFSGPTSGITSLIGL